MPRRGRNGGKRRGGGGGFNSGLATQIFKMPFSICFNLVSEAVGFNTNFLIVHPLNLGPNLARISSCFDWYRVVKLRCKFVPGVHAVNSESYQFAVSYSSTPQDTSGPGGLTQMSEMPCFNMTDGATCSIVVPRRELLGVAVKWFRSQTTGTPTTSELDQGIVWLASLFGAAASTNLTHVCQVSGICEFRSPIDEADSIAIPRPLVVSDDDEKGVLVSLPKKQGDSRAAPRPYRPP